MLCKYFIETNFCQNKVLLLVCKNKNFNQFFKISKNFYVGFMWIIETQASKNTKFLETKCFAFSVCFFNPFQVNLYFYTPWNILIISGVKKRWSECVKFSVEKNSPPKSHNLDVQNLKNREVDFRILDACGCWGSAFCQVLVDLIIERTLNAI